MKQIGLALATVALTVAGVAALNTVQGISVPAAEAENADTGCCERNCRDQVEWAERAMGKSIQSAGKMWGILGAFGGADPKAIEELAKATPAYAVDPDGACWCRWRVAEPDRIPGGCWNEIRLPAKQPESGASKGAAK